MNDYKQSKLWKKTLGKTGDTNQESIDKLREVFYSFRSKVELLASEISRSLPEFTVHDITHIDALWEMADCICGDSYELNPAEGFILGGAFLLHDVAMSFSAYPDGFKELEKTEIWKDTVHLWYKQKGKITPESATREAIDNDAKEFALATVLRKKHASTAEKLITTKWLQKSTGEEVFLIDDSEIRMSVGRTIGKIAHSHWWDLAKVESEFSRPLGALGWCPRDWTIDPLKIACILRVSDASHIDSRRAPSFLRSLRNLNPTSDAHWSFQEKLQKPYLTEDSLNYSSGYSFPASEASAWWLCYDALKMIDKELRQTDALLADKHLPRFKAKRVFAVESPERLASYIQTEDWSPIDAFIHIGDLPKIIRSLGGEELYGRKLNVPIRELIQNSSDAIRARRLVESRDHEWGLITIKQSESGESSSLEVEDNGLGMSLDVIKNYLFEFGSSYWDSELMQEEHPGLVASNVNHTGKYGIGFFSIFMLGDAVTITTRKFSDAQDKTYVIEFKNGLQTRPIIRKAARDEFLIDGGTRIKIEFDTKTVNESLFKTHDEMEITIEDVCMGVAPALDVQLKIIDKNKNTKEVPANNWLKCNNSDFIDLVLQVSKKEKLSTSEQLLTHKNKIAANVRVLKNSKKETLGRIFLSKDSWFRKDENIPVFRGCIVVNGLTEYYTSNICGFLVGKNTNAARDKGNTLATEDDFKDWVTEQAELLPSIFDESSQFELSHVVRILKGSPKNLPIARTPTSYLNYDDLGVIIEKTNKLIVCTGSFLRHDADNFISINYEEDLIFIDFLRIPELLGHQKFFLKSIKRKRFAYELTNIGFVCDIIAEKWDVPIEKILDFLSNELNNSYGNKIKIATTSEDKELRATAYVFERELLTK